MFFKRRPPEPLDQVFIHISHALDILYQHKRDKYYMPTTEELALFDSAHQAFWQASNTAEYIARHLKQRFAGESEGAKKFTDEAVFNYHYPDSPPPFHGD